MTTRAQKPRTRRRPAAARPRRIAAALAVTAALLLPSGCVPGPEEVVAHRGLQSVDIRLGPDGAITEIDDTIVLAGEDPSRTQSNRRSHEPGEVIDEVPLRVQTSYRSDTGSGSRLSDLEGYTGRVEITFSIENLTVAPQALEYDAAGQSRTRQALVGVPFTVAAATTLPGVSPSRVLTVRPDDSGPATDGMVSRTEEGDALVQWAAMLAPPAGIAGTDFTLVADVADFTVPQFDLTAQPGLSTEPGLGGTLDAAFDSSPASQLELERRTIEVIVEVNEILSEASGTLVDIRTNLDASSASLGVRSAEDLRNSTAAIGSSAQALQGQLDGLQQDLAGSLEASDSVVLEQLNATVAAVEQILGDTSAPPPAWANNGEGCAASPAAPTPPPGVYGGIQHLGAALEAYAGAVGACREQLRTELQRSLGPQEPTVENCTEPSATCALFGASLAVNSAFAQFIADGQSIAASLRPELVGAVSQDLDEVSAAVDAVATESEALGATGSTTSPSPGPSVDLDAQLNALRDSLRSLDETSGSLEDSLATVHDAARQAHAELGPVEQAGSIQAQNAELADRLCGLLAPDSAAQAGLSVEEVESLRAYLTDQPCPGSGAAGPLPPPPGYSAPMDQRLAQQASAWQQILAMTDPSGEGVAAKLAAFRSGLRDALAQLEVIGTAPGQGRDTADRLARLQETVADLQTRRDELDESFTALEEQQNELGPAITEAFAQAGSSASESVSAIIDEQTRIVSEDNATRLDRVDEMFRGSVEGLNASADGIREQGTQAVESNRGQAAAAQQAAAAIPQRTQASLRGIATAVDASTRDAEAVQARLVADLGEVMLDLGTPAPGAPGILGAMATSAARVGTADYQLALATQSAAAYANVRAEDVDGILLRQAQIDASFAAAAEMSPFQMQIGEGTDMRTVYSFHIGGEA